MTQYKIGVDIIPILYNPDKIPCDHCTKGINNYRITGQSLCSVPYCAALDNYLNRDRGGDENE